MTIKMELTEWEVMVLRAALANYRTLCKSEKHLAATKEIERKSRAQDDPIAALKRREKRDGIR